MKATTVSLVEIAMESYVLSTGPLSICIDANNWYSYTTGVLRNCGHSQNHCAQITGYNGDKGYWIVSISNIS
jgi:hypothetical protein